MAAKLGPERVEKKNYSFVTRLNFFCWTAALVDFVEAERKPGKDGIRIRLQMLQNKLSSGKTSDNMKQKMFERDLELEMLRRKKNYQNSGNK